jgi:hypothetical protein
MPIQKAPTLIHHHPISSGCFVPQLAMPCKGTHIPTQRHADANQIQKKSLGFAISHSISFRLVRHQVSK